MIRAAIIGRAGMREATGRIRNSHGSRSGVATMTHHVNGGPAGRHDTDRTGRDDESQPNAAHRREEDIIARSLRTLYDDVTAEPMPERFRTLLKTLAEQEERGDGSGSGA